MLRALVRCAANHAWLRRRVHGSRLVVRRTALTRLIDNPAESRYGCVRVLPLSPVRDPDLHRASHHKVAPPPAGAARGGGS